MDQKQLQDRVATRFFKYKEDYVVVYLFPKGDNLITGKHLIFRSTQTGSPVIVLEHYAFNDNENFVINRGTTSKWIDHEMELSDILKMASMNETQLFVHINSNIGSWVLSSLQSDTLLLNWLLPEHETGYSSDDISKIDKKEENEVEPTIESCSKGLDIARLRFFSKDDRRLLVIDGKSDLFLVVELMPTPNCGGYATFTFRQDRPFFTEIEQPKWKESEVEEQEFIDSIPNINNILRNLIESTNELFGLDSIQFIKMLSLTDSKETVINENKDDKTKETIDG